MCSNSSPPPSSRNRTSNSAVHNWFVYILRCADGTLYTGVTTDPARRLREHNAGGRLGARYTRARRPLELAHCEVAASRSEACRREAAIKKLTVVAKWALIGGAGAGPAGMATLAPDSAIAASAPPG